jgi:4-amino-4-deoxy-L-arabinose transferase-like glycosyltransferase
VPVFQVGTVVAPVCGRKNAFIRVYLLPSVADFCPWLPLFLGARGSCSGDVEARTVASESLLEDIQAKTGAGVARGL